MLAEARLVMLAANRGTKGLRRFMMLGKDMFNHAPTAARANMTCT